MGGIKNHSSETTTPTPLHRRESSGQLVSKIPRILPHERVFPVQIGSELFKLSGASLSSDAPSYFSQYFQCQIRAAEEKGEDVAIRTLYIDRDPITFKDISLHLQGYHVQPRDGQHYVRLFADAQFYSLPKLISQLYEESIFVSIGHREFKIPRDLFSEPGNSPNYFSLGFAVFFSSPEDLFPGLDREGLIRPPSILPPSVPGRSAAIFDEMLHLLRGYPVHIRDEIHRQALLRDVRYFNFKGLEQRLIPHSISYNQCRQRQEMVMRLPDILKSGVTVAAEAEAEATLSDPAAGWVNYARPFVDTQPHELILEIGAEATMLHLGHGHCGARVEFFRDAKIRMARLFEVIASKLHPGLVMAIQPAAAILDPNASISLDGRPWTGHSEGVSADDPAYVSSSVSQVQFSPGSMSSSTVAQPTRKRPRLDREPPGFGSSVSGEWMIRTGQWRLRIQAAKDGQSAVECVLVAVKLDALSSEQARNASRGFLSG